MTLGHWDIICRSKQKGGLVIKNLVDTNASLMEKWVRDILDENAGAWRNVLLIWF